LLIAAAATIFSVAYYSLFIGDKHFTNDAIIWFGIFDYFIENMAGGNFPYWDPFMTTGTHFYPVVQVEGLLDPLVLVFSLIYKFLHISPLTLYVYFRIVRLIIFSVGTYFFFRHISGNSTAALLSALALFFALPISYFRQAAVELIYLTPFALHSILLFIEDPKGPKRYLYLSCVALATGISMNIYIPILYIFNFVVFTAVATALNMGRLRETKASLSDRKSVLFILTMLVLVLCMAAPPIAVLFKDASGDGELFPVQRLIPAAKCFKIIMASDISTDSMSGQFREGLATFFSSGNVLQLLWPDLSVFNYFTAERLSVTTMYIGILPFLFSIVGLIFSKSRYKYLLLISMLLIFINGFSLIDANGPYNFIQRIFNSLFPMLGKLQTRFHIGFFVIFYLCALTSMGLALFFREDFLRKKGLALLSISLLIVILKICVLGYLKHKWSDIPGYDLFLICQLLLLGLLIFLYKRKQFRVNTMYISVIIIIFIDFLAYNVNFGSAAIQRYNFVIGTSGGHSALFRESTVYTNGLAYGESIAKTRGAMSLGYNHSFFTTKRYYDFYTHVPMHKQYFLNGVVYPIVRFFPVDAVRTIRDKKALLEYFAAGDRQSLADYLFMEEGGADKPALSKLANLDSYQCNEDLTPENIYAFAQFISENKDVQSSRSNPDEYLNSPLWSLSMNEPSVNRATISVRNIVDGYLYFNDGWSRYWHAFDGDKEIPIRTANYNFKAVFLPKGEHTVSFAFNPVYYKAGLVLYYLGLVSAIGLIGFFYFSRRVKDS